MEFFIGALNLIEAHEKVAPSVIWSIIGTAAMSVIIAIAGSPYQGQSKQVVMGSQAAFIVLFIFTLLIFACVLRLIKRDKQGLVKN